MDYIALLYNFLYETLVFCKPLSFLNMEIKLIERNNGQKLLMRHNTAISVSDFRKVLLENIKNAFVMTEQI